MDIDDLNSGPVTFAGAADRHGLSVGDAVEDRSFTLETDAPVEFESAAAGRFVFPVDAAVSFVAEEVRTPPNAGVLLRDESGDHLGEFGQEAWEVSRGTYYLEVSTTPKTYLHVSDASFTARYQPGDWLDARCVVSFDEPTRVVVGARSLHERPRATVTVPDDPEAVATAFSHLGSSMKEFSAERSWPTVRGHPPAVEPGDELDVPDGLARPRTGVTVTVPPDYADLYRVAPLAFYLGATVECGPEPELHLDVGYTEPLGRGPENRSLEAAVDSLLAKCFFLDTLVRTDGYYSLPRHEYDRVAPELPFYPPNLYDLPVAEQLVEYLEVPTSVVEPHLPQWPTTAVLRPDLADVAVVPYLLDSLSRIHVAAGPDAYDPPGAVAPSSVTAYAAGTPPDGGARLSPAALEHALEASPTDVEEASVRFVGGRGDPRESVVGPAPEAALDGVEFVDAPTVGDLRGALRADADFLHFGGTVTDRGFACSDGVLAFADLPTVGATLVGLGGTAEVGAALELVDGGAVGAVATASRPPATLVGRLAGYLLTGFPLVDAVELSGLSDATACRFAGDATRVAVQQAEGRSLWHVVVASESEADHRVATSTRPSDAFGVGSVTRFAQPFVQDAYHLMGASVDYPLPVSTSQVVDLLHDEDNAVELNGRVVHRGSEATAETVRDSARRVLDERSP